METDAEKVAFMDAIFNKQFFNIDPDLDTLPKLVRMAYKSEYHILNKSVSAFLRTGELLNPKYRLGLPTPEDTLESTLESTPEEVEEKEKVEVEVEERKTTTTNPPKRLDVFNYQTDRDKIALLIKNDKTKLLVYRNCKGFKMTDENYNTLINTFLDFKAGTVFNHTNINDILGNFVLWTPSELKRLREAKTNKK